MPVPTWVNDMVNQMWVEHDRGSVRAEARWAPGAEQASEPVVPVVPVVVVVD